MKHYVVFRSFDASGATDKDDVMQHLRYYKGIYKTKSMVKKVDEFGATVYQLVLKNGKEEDTYKIVFPKKYQEHNTNYMNEFDMWVNKHKKSNLAKLKLAAVVCGISIAGTSIAYEPVISPIIENVTDLFPNEVDALEREILIHSGHYEEDGRQVYPQYDHDCVFVDDKTISVEERISIYCEEHGLEYLEEAALQKYYYLYHDQMELANSIDLEKLEKEEKQKVKSFQ